VLAAAAGGVLLPAGWVAPVLGPYSYSSQSLTQRLKPPGREHWLGTDGFGPDVVSRLMGGSPVSLQIGFAATALSLLAGTLLGGAAGYFGRGADQAIMRTADAFLSVP